MEPHALPQNITSFEFHLVGDMTLKQFAYLASGLGFAYLIFVLVFPLSPILALPIMAFSSLLGTALAFFPLYDRPLDHWLTAYFKAVYSPTQAVWTNPYDKKAKLNPLDPFFKTRLRNYLARFNTANQPVLTPPKITRLVPIQAKPNHPQPISPSSEELTHLVEMAKEAEVTRQEFLKAEQEIKTLKALLLAKEQTNPNVVPTSKPIIVQPLPKTQSQMMLTSLPNVINGVVTDSLGNYLEGVIVIIHNSDHIPVRALKTNKLGQFAGATSLPLGVYTLTLEKDNLDFDTLQIGLNGQVLAPIKITAKKKEAIN